MESLNLPQTEDINQSACDLAKDVAEEGGVFCAGSINQTGTLYAGGAGKDDIQKRFDAQIQIFLKNDLDFLIAEVGLCFFSFFCKSCSLHATSPISFASRGKGTSPDRHM